MLIDATVADVSRRCAVGYAAVEGALARVSTTVDWAQFETLDTVGIDEIALRKGHRHDVAVVSCRDAAGQLSVLGVLADRLKALAYLEHWQAHVVASGLRCFDAFMTTLGNWRDEICNDFNGRHSSDFVEGLNNKLKVIKRRCYGLLDPVRLFQRIQLDLEGEALFA